MVDLNRAEPIEDDFDEEDFEPEPYEGGHEESYENFPDVDVV